MTTQDIQLIQSTYNPQDCEVGIIHVGPGNFHRSHQAVYVHKLMSELGLRNWGIAGVSIRGEGKALLDEFKKCGSGYILETISSSGEFCHEEITSIVDLYDWQSEQQDVLPLFALDTVQMLTITVTESGYYLNNDGSLDVDAKEIVEDLSSDLPKTVFGFLYQGLKHRMNSGGKPITVVCCDNLQNNGKLLESCFNQYVELMGDQELLNWLSVNASFPCGMVDRITPKPSTEVVNSIKDKYNLSGGCVVVAEDYIQWVLEDKFAGNKPPLDKVGVQIVKDVHPYEETKIRILNAGHTALAYLGVLEGYQTYDQAIRDSKLSEFFNCIQKREILPALPSDYPIDYPSYLATTKKRFTNQHISDSLERICMDGVEKFKVFLKPTIEGMLAKGSMPTHSLRVIASWYVFSYMVLNKNIETNYYEPSWDLLVSYLDEDKVREFASSAELWGEIPERYASFVDALVHEIEEMKLHYLGKI